jgi:site-specific DNA recombinase
MADLPALFASKQHLQADGDESDTSDRRVAVYARTSSASQKYGYSIDEQVRQCVERCQILGWTVSHVFRDEAVSGKDTDRPMFQELLTVAEDGNLDIVVFWKLDRFSRSIMHAVQLEKQFREWGVALHSITEQIDTTTAAGRFNFRNIANAAEFERDLIKQRTKMGHTARAMEYKWPNATPPLGYGRADGGRLEVLPAEATLVRHIFRLYCEQRSMPRVAEILIQDDRTTKQGSDWTPRSVSDLLRNDLYTGQYSVGEVEEDVPEYQILSQERFDEVTAIRTRFQRTSDTTRSGMERSRKHTQTKSVLEDYSGFLLS